MKKQKQKKKKKNRKKHAWHTERLKSNLRRKKREEDKLSVSAYLDLGRPVKDQT